MPAAPDLPLQFDSIEDTIQSFSMFVLQYVPPEDLGDRIVPDSACKWPHDVTPRLGY